METSKHGSYNKTSRKKQTRITFYQDGLKVHLNRSRCPNLNSSYSDWIKVNVFVDYMKMPAFFDLKKGKCVRFEYSGKWHSINITPENERIIESENSFSFLVKEHHCDIRFCKKCKAFKPKTTEFFMEIKAGIRDGRQRVKLSKVCLSCLEKEKQEKTCNSCNKTFPRTTDFFYYKKCSGKTKDGEIKTYDTLKHVCKDCFKEKSKERHKRVYWSDPVKARRLNSEKRSKYLGWIKKYSRRYYRENIEARKDYDKKRTRELTDSKVANYLGLRTDEIPTKIINQKRLIIKLNRLIKQKKDD